MICLKGGALFSRQCDVTLRLHAAAGHGEKLATERVLSCARAESTSQLVGTSMLNPLKQMTSGLNQCLRLCTKSYCEGAVRRKSAQMTLEIQQRQIRSEDTEHPTNIPIWWGKRWKRSRHFGSRQSKTGYLASVRFLVSKRYAFLKKYLGVNMICQRVKC